MAEVRIKKDLKQWNKNPLECAKIIVDRNDYRICKDIEVLYYGPDKTPYENGTFKIQVKFSSNYPFHAPSVHFKTKIYHINVNNAGKVYFAQLREWDDKYTLRDIIVWLDEVIRNPDVGYSPKMPISDDMDDEFVNERETYQRKAREYARKYAIPHIEEPEEKQVNYDENKNDNENENDNNHDNTDDNDENENKEIEEIKNVNKQLELEIKKLNKKNKDMQDKLKQFEQIVSEKKYV